MSKTEDYYVFGGFYGILKLFANKNSALLPDFDIIVFYSLILCIHKTIKKKGCLK